MFCQNCGTQLPDNSNFCPNCGSSQYQQPQYQQPQYQQPQYQQQGNQLYQTFEQYNPFGQQQIQSGAEHPMKWYDFVVKIQLFVAAAISLVSGILSVTGLQYGDSKEGVYKYVYGSQEIDIVCGIVSIALAAYAIYVRQMLVKYKASAPMLYILYLIFYFVNDVIEPIFSTIVSGTSMLGLNFYSIIITTAVMVYCNAVYFKKRQYMFYN